MNDKKHWSRLKGFFSLDVLERRKILSTLPLNISEEDFAVVDAGLSLHDADRMSENVVGTFSLPFSIAANFVVDSKPCLVPMVTEEPSIVAACSKIAKIVAKTGGFHTSIDPAIIKGQIQIYKINNLQRAIDAFAENKESIMAAGRALASSMHKRGGGLKDITMRSIFSPHIGPMLVIEPEIDVVDAMGANFINTFLENLSEKIAGIFDGSLGIRILSNLSDQRLARAYCYLPVDTDLREKMLAAHAFAEADIYRACTHNKGILNGIDAVAIACGNDFRAIEAGAHAYASINGYRPLTRFVVDDNDRFRAELTLPLSVGVVGGIGGVHNGVRLAHKILGDFSKTAKQMASVMVSAGLSQCCAALLALSGEGLQKGHMKLHKKKMSFREPDHRFVLEPRV